MLENILFAMVRFKLCEQEHRLMMAHYDASVLYVLVYQQQAPEATLKKIKPVHSALTCKHQDGPQMMEMHSCQEMEMRKRQVGALNMAARHALHFQIPSSLFEHRCLHTPHLH
eukprot:scaffold204326_cov19-Tisochrysis_lutea.AAC.1